MKNGNLRVAIRLAGRFAAGWREPLAAGLRADGHSVGFVEGPAEVEPAGLSLLALLERVIYGGPPAAAPAPAPLDEGAFDLIVAGGAELGRTETIPVLILSCDGDECARGAAAALLDMRSPILEAQLQVPGEQARIAVARGQAALEEPHVYYRSRARVDQRLAALARGAVRRISAEGPAPLPLEERAAAAGHAGDPFAFAARTLTNRVTQRLARLARRGPRWRVAWRMTSGDEVAQRGAWSAFAFHPLADDGKRYFADPFVCDFEGRCFIFCEEFPYATGRGLVSVVEIREGRALGAPRPVLEQSYHLSYPMTFFRDGAFWMIPEASAAARIELWRAERFPDQWRREAILVEGVAASDATLLESDGVLWLFATVAEGLGSSWDSLWLWSAERLEGPWRPHPANPVLVDASCARPAGMPFRRAGRWMRPAQDCSRIYGGGLALCAIDRLDRDGFAQSVAARLAPPPGSGGSGVHTLNAAAHIEAIDIFGPPDVLRGRRPLSSGDADRPRSPVEISQEGLSS